MKKKVFLVAFLAAMLQHAISQNIGIGTTSPASKLDVNGDIAFRSTDITITTTYNYALDVNTTKLSSYKLKQNPIPVVGNFIISGITAGAEGRIISLYNRSGASMEIYNEDANATAANRITTGTGTTFAVYNGGAIALRYDASTQRWEIIGSHYNSLNYFGGGGGGYFTLSGTDIYNSNTGNVGIGNTSPFYKLDVSGMSRVVGTGISSPASLGYLTSGGGLRIGDNADAYYITADGYKIQAEKGNANTSGSSASILALNPFGGKVGIGLTNPRSRLSILSTTVESNNNTEVLQIAGKNPVMYISDANGTNHGYIKGVTDNTQTPQFPGAGLEIGAVPGTDLFLSANFSPVLTVAQNNTVGIGTTTPNANYKLSVNGVIRAKEVVVETGWADYVFDDTYKLRSLDEVAVHIQQHKHLPGIPSAKEIEASGLKVGEVQAKMMEKIEELTLYVIELKKEIELLKAKN